MEEIQERYICPMHPEVSSEKPGLCPECGMNLVPSKADEQAHHGPGGHDTHEGHTVNIFKIRFWVSLVLSVPVLAYSDVVQELLRFEAPAFAGSAYIPLILASIIFFYGGWIFIASAVRELKARLPGMMTLIALAILTAYSYSIFVTVAGEGKPLFWELATLITVMLLGHWMEMRAVTGAQGALKELSKLIPDEAEVIRHGGTVIVSLDELEAGDTVLVKPGARVPTDGVIQEGTSDVDESIITGESNPVSKRVGDDVIAGTTNGDGSLTVRVSNVGKDTFLAGVMRLVAEAQASKSKLQMLSDRAAYYLTLIAVVTGGVTLAWWLSVGEASFAFERMVAVLVIACPHALGLAIPLVASISTTMAARNGFLVKRRLSLEAARNIDVVLFDKTGTLTKGEFGLDRIIAAESSDEQDVLRYAASVNAHSEHPIAQAMTKEARTRGIELFTADDFQRLPGRGARARVDSKEVIVGNREEVLERGLSLEGELRAESDGLAGQGKTVVFVVVDNRVIGAVSLADVIRVESREAITSLRDAGIQTAMVTGDSEEVAKWVAGALGIDDYYARVLPDRKAEKVKQLQSEGKRVAVVGDGVNDAPALAQADLGIAIGAGTNVAIESAGIILIRNDPRDIAKIVRLSKLTYTKMIQNLFWATGYNIIAIPLAAGVFASRGIFLNPAVAAFLMSLSTVIVATNAVLLKRQSLG